MYCSYISGTSINKYTFSAIPNCFESPLLRLEEIEQQYVGIEVANCQPKRGEKKPKLNGVSKGSQLTDYAAELVFHFLSKVISPFTFKLNRLKSLLRRHSS